MVKRLHSGSGQSHSRGNSPHLGWSPAARAPRSVSRTGSPSVHTSGVAWSNGDGSIRFHPSQRIPSLEVVGAPGLMEQLASCLESTIADERPVTTFRHSQSPLVRMVKVAGRRAQVALRVLYLTAGDALPRKRQAALEVMAWKPSVRSRYPWERWGDGNAWLLQRGPDYDDVRRLWEPGVTRRQRSACSCTSQISETRWWFGSCPGPRRRRADRSGCRSSTSRWFAQAARPLPCASAPQPTRRLSPRAGPVDLCHDAGLTRGAHPSNRQRTRSF